MSNKLKSSGAIIAMFALAVILIPLIFIYTVNNLAALGGIDFYLEYGYMEWAFSLIFLILVRGNK